MTDAGVQPECPAGFAVFDTVIGPCSIAWGERGIVGVQLPERDEALTRARMQARFPALAEALPPPGVRAAIDATSAMLAGAPLDLLEIVLDEEGVPEFHRRVYAIARRIRPGQTRTYGEVAEELGGKGLARAVGQALGRNPFAPIVPCHRVLAADGRPGGFSAPGGALAKMRMLHNEGARPTGTASLFDAF
ncbi:MULTISPECIES: methylated-DNA--[protein]-cysteine S-methyltransferase [unclassified Variovorax]|uniref:methylated-DNA--[protein]-cysteine S-methyltransferase n=1 Tax=unclassified Variovorax TaxID=663243 RepID=UPI0025775AF5|nr:MULTISPECIES: methylated-DNA--[protein]-cysteine S-methyltransferase [unclassified Variovorax]MDM0089051.1 methylated-DNA--[protein]-cysteine S-methyltransferase [Variovorax sp. J22G40]MDM0147124.1 methylated-DNA--[protein]-cysteine S-methyltransferase [Variovorax sp. J2P1-31]